MSDSKYSFEMEHAVFEILDFLQAQFGQRKLCINTGNRSIQMLRLNTIVKSELISYRCICKVFFDQIALVENFLHGKYKLN